MSMKSADNDKSVTAGTSSSSSWDWTKTMDKAESVIKTIDTMGKTYTALKSDFKDAIGSWSDKSDTSVNASKGNGVALLPLAIAGGVALLKLI